MIRLVLPKGSLQEETIRLFKEASLDINGDEDDAWINDKRIAETRFLRAQEIARYVDEGYFDLGITGLDWVRESRAKVKELSDLCYGKVRLVIILPEKSEICSPREIKPNSKVVSEYENLTNDYFNRLGIPIDFALSYGATEQKVSAGIADAALDNTVTGRTIRKAGLKIIDECMKSSARLIANEEIYSQKMDEMNDIMTLLEGARDARNKVVLEMNVPGYCLEKAAGILPAMRSPTISELYGNGDKWYAMKTVVSRDEAKYLIPDLKRIGAQDIIEYLLSKVIR